MASKRNCTKCVAHMCFHKKCALRYRLNWPILCEGCICTDKFNIFYIWPCNGVLYITTKSHFYVERACVEVKYDFTQYTNPGSYLNNIISWFGSSSGVPYTYMAGKHININVPITRTSVIDVKAHQQYVSATHCPHVTRKETTTQLTWR